jgi:hypothetical protein
MRKRTRKDLRLLLVACLILAVLAGGGFLSLL